ncbi:hypothetical protein BC332_19416, partial [Capsicum chinense]
MLRRHNHTHNPPSPSPISSPNPNSHPADTAAVSHSGAMSDDKSPSPTAAALTVTPAVSSRTAAFPAREDCWSEAATHTLIEAWGGKYVELNKGSLRHQHWEAVADAVNALHGHTKKQYRTEMQCKNRIDTLKKKYKIEKAKVSESPGRYFSTWPFFSSLNALLGVTVKASPPPPFTQRRTPTQPVMPPHQWRAPPRPEMPPLQWRPPPPDTSPLEWRTPSQLPPPLLGVPVASRSKRPGATIDYTVSRRNFSAMAAAAAGSSDDSEEEEEEKEESETSSLAASAMANASSKSKRKRNGGLVEGYKMLAEAVGKFSETYERVEKAKQRQMVELEKQRMQFTKDLEIQRMKLMMESQVHLEKLKRSNKQFRR